MSKPRGVNDGIQKLGARDSSANTSLVWETERRHRLKTCFHDIVAAQPPVCLPLRPQFLIAPLARPRRQLQLYLRRVSCRVTGAAQLVARERSSCDGVLGGRRRCCLQLCLHSAAPSAYLKTTDLQFTHVQSYRTIADDASRSAESRHQSYQRCKRGRTSCCSIINRL